VTPPAPRPLTPRQAELLGALARYQAGHGYSPTLEELGQLLGVNRMTAYGHVQALLRKGLLENLEPGLSRGLEITPEGRAALDRLQNRPRPHDARPETAPSLPLLGRIAAGHPLEALENPETVDPLRLLPPDGRHYLLEVQGESMIEAHIQPGDWVLVRRDLEPLPGDLVVAVLEDGEATLKFWQPTSRGTVRLVPANPAFPVREVERAECRGVVLRVLRNLKP